MIMVDPKHVSNYNMELTDGLKKAIALLNCVILYCGYDDSESGIKDQKVIKLF